jgi:hypothetical protein
MIVLIICLSCIGIAVITTILIIPFTFILENESYFVALKWEMISLEGKKHIINNINNFTNILHKN